MRIESSFCFYGNGVAGFRRGGDVRDRLGEREAAVEVGVGFLVGAGVAVGNRGRVIAADVVAGGRLAQRIGDGMGQGKGAAAAVVAGFDHAGSSQMVRVPSASPFLPVNGDVISVPIVGAFT